MGFLKTSSSVSTSPSSFVSAPTMPGPVVVFPNGNGWPAEEVTDVDAKTEVDGRAAPDPGRASYAPPSRQELLQRAAELGPQRLTWESFVASPDPILGEKMQPHVAERRARFRKVVKAALGTCIACCLVAMIVTAVSGSTASAATTALANVPATSVTSVEKLELPKHTKLSRAPAYASVPTYAIAAHARSGKRR